MKLATPESLAEISAIPPKQEIPAPDFPNRSGVTAAGVAVLVIVSLFCIFQYWLLTATLEAWHAGDTKLPVGAFCASMVCFILATSLTLAGEVALVRQQNYLCSTSIGFADKSHKTTKQTLLVFQDAKPGAEPLRIANPPELINAQASAA